MDKNEQNKITFGVFNSMPHHQWQMEKKVKEIQDLLTGRNRPLLPEDWTDEDAWDLARDLTNIMGQIKTVRKTIFCKENPYPDQNTPLEDIPYYNYIYQEPPEIPIDFWTEVLHCGILIIAGKPNFCFPSNGTFADLEELFRGIIRSGGGPTLGFDYILNRLDLSADRFRELQEMDFDPVPPSFEEPEDSLEESIQARIYEDWQEWEWLRHYPCRKELQKAIQEITSKERYGQVKSFIQQEIGLEDVLRQAINLYLYQAGACGMTDESYFVTYAMLCRTKKKMLAAMEKEGLL